MRTRLWDLERFCVNSSACGQGWERDSRIAMNVDDFVGFKAMCSGVVNVFFAVFTNLYFVIQLFWIEDRLEKGRGEWEKIKLPEKSQKNPTADQRLRTPAILFTNFKVFLFSAN